MTIDEAIAHALEVAEKNECKMTSDDGYTDVSMKQCAADHRQLAEWLKELKLLRKKAKHLTEWNRKLIDYKNEIICKWGESQEELQEAKRLLKLAVEDMNSNNICFDINACNVCTEKNCISCDTFHWRYTDEAEKLINS